MKHVLEYFGSLKPDESWAYANLTPKETGYLTHSYHRYPAKFIPQLARRIIKRYSSEEELICDPFVGCGTTPLEALLIQRRTLGVDINPVAYLITKAKITCIEPQLLRTHVTRFFTKLNSEKDRTHNSVMTRVKESPNYDRIRFWFDDDTIRDLSCILSFIENIEETAIQDFLKCGFSHILKNCSRWKTESLKPLRDKNKKIPKAMPTFKRHIKHMTIKNRTYYQNLPEKVRKHMSEYAEIFCDDCRNIPSKDERVSLIVTSPPYVTSYEYADLQQLTLLWLTPEVDITVTRKNHIGTTQPKNIGVKEVHSEVANEILRRFRNKASKIEGKRSYYLDKCAEAVFTYFAEMQQALEEFVRILKPSGIACIIIGNTTIRGINIWNAEVLSEIAISLGFKLMKAIKRRIPTKKKSLPSLRDPKTGQFVSENSPRKKLVYPHEYILLLEKP